MKRIDGFYWIQSDRSLDWEPAEYDCGIWNVIGRSKDYDEDNFYRIGNRIEHNPELLHDTDIDSDIIIDIQSH